MMNPNIKKEISLKNAAIIGGTVLTFVFWKEILTLGVVSGGGWLIWKNRDKIKKYIHSSGKNS